MDTIINTVNVAAPVSRRDAQEIRATSWRTCLTNCAGDTLAIESYQYKFNFSLCLDPKQQLAQPDKFYASYLKKVI